MPKPTIVTGPPGPATEETFFAQVVEWCTDLHRAGRLRYIVPTARRRIDVEAAILDSCPRGRAICQSPVETLDRFTQKLFRASETTRIISWRATAMLIEMLLVEAAADFPVLLAGRTAPFPGLVRELLRSIRELKRFAVKPETLSAAAAKSDSKARELALIFQRYNAFLDENDWCDERDPFLVMARRLADRPFRKDALAPIDWVVFDGFVEFTPSELPIVHALVEHADTTFLLDNDPALTELSLPIPDWGADTQARRCSGTFVPLARLAVSQAPLARPPETPDVRFIEAATRDEEVERIATAIKTLARDGIAQRDIALAVPDLAQYAELVEEIFPSHGLPYTLSHQPLLLESPVTAAVLALLETPAHDFERTDVKRLFRSPYVHFEEHGAPLAPDVLEALARASRIFRGKQAWLDALRRRIASFEQRPPDAEIHDEEPVRERPEPADDLQRLQSLAPVLESAFALLDEMKKPRRVANYVARFRELITRFHIDRRAMACLRLDSSCAIHAHALTAITAALDELQRLGDAHPKARTVSLEAFIELFRSSVAGARVRGGVPLEGIEVLDIKHAGERRAKILFIAGLVEGAVPEPTRQGTLLDARVRAHLGLPSTESLTALKRIELYRALAAPSEKLVLSRPTLEAERPLLRPMVLERIVAALQLTPDEEPVPLTSWRHALGALGRNDPAFPPVEQLLADETLARRADLHTFVHARRVEHVRQAARHTPTPYAGALSETLLDRVKQLYDRSHEFSAGELETYVRCPFRFFAKWLLRLAPMEEPEEEIGPREKGHVLHAIFRDFYAEWSRQRDTGRIEAHNYDDALALLIEVARRHFSKQLYRGFVWEKFLARLLGDTAPTGEPVPGLFKRFLDVEIASMEPATACAPRYFELGFGHQRHAAVLDPHSREAPHAIEALRPRLQVWKHAPEAEGDPRGPKSPIAHLHHGGAGHPR